MGLRRLTPVSDSMPSMVRLDRASTGIYIEASKGETRSNKRLPTLDRDDDGTIMIKQKRFFNLARTSPADSSSYVNILYFLNATFLQ